MNFVPRFARVVPLVLIVFFLAAIPPGPGHADTGVLTVKTPEPVALRAGSTGTVRLGFTLREPWHVNAHRPTLDYLIPTTLTLSRSSSFNLVEVRYPAPVTLPLSFAEKPLAVYSGTNWIEGTLQSPPDLSPGRYRARLQLRYQPCRDDRCLRPVTRTIDLPVRVRGAKSPGGDSGSPGTLLGILFGDDGPSARDLGTYFQSGGWLGLLVVFLLGLSLNLTPCVYPMIPITVGYFGSRGGEAGTSPLSARVRDGVLFVLGMALIYSLLGGMAGYSGAILGRVLQQPLVLVTMALLMVLLGSSMLGLFSLRLPQPVHEGSRSLTGMLGSFGMGMTLGVAAAPCLAPATVAMLAFVGQQGSYWLGAGLFFVLSLGLGLPYLVLAVFSSSLSALPSSGRWLGWVEKLLGCVVFGVALYFLWPLVSEEFFPYFVLGWLALSGLLLITAHPPDNRYAFLLRALLVLLVVGSTMVWTQRNLRADPEGIQWIPGRSILTARSNSIPGPAVVYVAADWCVPCKEMQIKTFPNRDVQHLLDRVRAVKLDVTKPPPPPVNRWMMDHDVLGVPTMVFLDGRGREVEELRVEGFIGSRRLVRRLRKIAPEPDTGSTW